MRDTPLALCGECGTLLDRPFLLNGEWNVTADAQLVAPQDGVEVTQRTAMEGQDRPVLAAQPR